MDDLEDLRRVTLESLPALFRMHVARSEAGTGSNVRNRRELETLSLALDLIVMRRYQMAADVLVQRMKGIEMAARESTWDRAQHLELIAPSAGLLASREEMHAAAREERADAKSSAKPKPKVQPDFSKRTKPKGKGKGGDGGGHGAEAGAPA